MGVLEQTERLLLVLKTLLLESKKRRKQTRLFLLNTALYCITYSIVTTGFSLREYLVDF
jgi:hypothetical protein